MAVRWAGRADLRTFRDQGTGNGEQARRPFGRLRAVKSGYGIKGDLKVALGPPQKANPTTWEKAELKTGAEQASEEFGGEARRGT